MCNSYPAKLSYLGIIRTCFYGYCRLGVNAVEKGEVDSNEKRSLGPLVMSLEEEVLTLMATAGDQADFIAGRQLAGAAAAGGGSMT